MDPEYWGAPFWKLMHVLVRDHFDPGKTPDIIRILGKHLLPCSRCRGHFAKRISPKVRPIPTKTKSMVVFQHWLVALHNEVNKEKNKPVLSEIGAFNEIVRMRGAACYVPFVVHTIKVNIEGTRKYEGGDPGRAKADAMQKCFNRFLALLHSNLAASTTMPQRSRCSEWATKQKNPLPLPPISAQTLKTMREKRRPTAKPTAKPSAKPSARQPRKPRLHRPRRLRPNQSRKT